MAPAEIDRQVLRVAVVGSGPSGFYAADQLLKRSPVEVEVDMFDRLPTPYGLVRAGVAPDHPKIKSVTKVLDKIAGDPRFRYFGNVEIGTQVSTAELGAWYDAVLYAYGAASGRLSGIPGEHLIGSVRATDVVGWYNGHPDFNELALDLSCERAVVIGNGNVALDVARMLALPATELAKTDIADHALEALARSNVREVVVLGRRGPAQAAFTHAEIRELGELPGVGVRLDPRDFGPGEDPDQVGLDQGTQWSLAVMRDYLRREPTSDERTVDLRFRNSPVEVLGEDRVTGVTLVRNRLETHSDGRVVARPTPVSEHLEAGLVVHAVGYTGAALPGLPFDEDRGVVPNTLGRVSGRPQTYVAGWIKRGPQGVIGANKACATETVDALLADLHSGATESGTALPVEAVAEIVAARVGDLTDYADWAVIDAHETERGLPTGRPRVKFTSVAELVGAARGI